MKDTEIVSKPPYIHKTNTHKFNNHKYFYPPTFNKSHAPKVYLQPSYLDIY